MPTARSTTPAVPNQRLRRLSGGAALILAMILLGAVAGFAQNRIVEVAQSYDDTAATLAQVKGEIGQLVVFEREAQAGETISDLQIGEVIGNTHRLLVKAGSGRISAGLKADVDELDSLAVTYTGRLSQMVNLARADVGTEQLNSYYQTMVDPIGDTFVDALDDAMADAIDGSRQGRQFGEVSGWAMVTFSVLGACGLLLWGRRAAAKLEHAKTAQSADARLRAIVEYADELVIVGTTEGGLVYQSPSVERILGVDATELLGSQLFDKIHPDDLEELRSELRRVRHQPGLHARFDARVAHPSGGYRHLQIDVTNLSHDPAIGGIVMNARDLSDRVSLQADLAYQARHDPLTGLANRSWFRVELASALERANASDTVSVVLIDLDGFKEVNDRMGHQAGDEVLIAAAARLATLTRGRDSVARLGGDEFALFIVGDPPAAVAQRIVEMLAIPVQTVGGEARVSASVGVATASGTAGIESLLAGADMAMYDAKERGKNRYSCFSEDMAAAAQARQTLRDDLDTALAEGQFRLVYQPKMRLEDGSVEGFEALVRWAHPTRGVVAPMEFIPFAESTGQIVALGHWVLAEALDQLRRWQVEGHDGGRAEQLSMAINVSIRQLAEPSIVDDVAAELARTGVDPATVTLEITETMLIADQNVVADALGRLKALGVRIAVDDYGAGHASINYLRRFPIDILKIDRSFVAALDTDPIEARAYLRSITDLASALSLDLIAEGIEHAEQLDCLRRMGCHLGQGYHLARPLDVQAAEGFLADHAATTIAD